MGIDATCMVESQPRLIRVGLPQNSDPRRMAVAMVLLMIISLAQPVGADISVSRNDFGVLDELNEILSKRTDNDEATVATQEAVDALNAVDLAQRPVDSSDPLSQASGYLDSLELRDASPFVADHPRPYEFLMDASTQPEGWPYNLFETLFSVEALGLTNPLAIGVNTYAIYVNFSSRAGGPSHEAWVEGTFTGEILVGTELALFRNDIDIDNDSVDDLSVSLTIEGLIDQDDGFGFEFGDCGLPPLTIPCIEEFWIRPTFQWKVNVINPSALLWDNLSHLEVSLMKGLAFDLTLDESESYAIVIDTRFTQPPHDFRLSVGLQKMTFSVNAVITNALDFLASLLAGGVNSSSLSLTSISAPYAISASNPDSDSSNRQSDCNDGSGYYDPILDHDAESDEHKCGFGLGVGFIRFEGDNGGTSAKVLELAYIDAGFHPEVGDTRLPNEVDITLRNDNLGKNTFDTVEIYSDYGADMYLHYFEDRSNTTEGDSPFGNTTDSRTWIRGLPSGTLHPDEIAAIFTMIGEEPGGIDLPGDIPSQLSMIIAIKNFTNDKTNNVNDPTLPVNPASPPNTLVAIVATESIDLLEYKSTFMRGGYASDSSSIVLNIANVPKVIIVEGSFEIPESGLSRVNYDNPNLNSIAQIFDNALLTIVEVILDVGDVVNGIPESIVGTAGASGGAVSLSCYNQVRLSLPTSTREPMEIGLVSIAISSSDQPWLPNIDHILLSEDTNIKTVNGRLGGPQSPLVPIAMSARIGGISSVSHIYDPINDVRHIDLRGVSGGPLLIGHILHDDGDLVNSNQQSATISNRPSTFNVTQTSEALTYSASVPIGTITYGGSGDGQRNAIRLSGLPSSFQLILGDTVGYVASTPMDSIEVQLTNATQPLTMDGDHFRFWVNETEASLSTSVSDVTSIRRLSPLDPGASGPEGNSRIELIRGESSPMNVLLEDETNYLDKFKGMNGRISIDPLPSNITVAYPSGVDSTGLELPTFDEGDGVQALSFFLGDLVNFGSLINDFVYSSVVDLGGLETNDENMSLGLDLVTGELFDVTMDVQKGTKVVEQPEWSHGLGMEVFEATVVSFNLTRMPNYTLSSRSVVDNALADYRINETDYQPVFDALKAANVTSIDHLLNSLKDGIILDSEIEGVNLSIWEEQGITYEIRRSWHLRSWLPNMPSGRIILEYEFSMVDEIPEYEVDLFLEQWTPKRQQMSIIINGLEGRDLEFVIAGLDTSGPNNVEANAVFSTQDNLTVPRVSIDMYYDLGTRLDSAHAIFIDQRALSRVEALIVGVPQSTGFSSTIGDVFLINVTVPPQYQIDGHSAESLMIQQMRYVDGFWWPATAFMRDLPGVMNLDARPNTVFDIREDISFQGVMELDYHSNTDGMDLYLEASGRSVDTKGDMLLLAEDLPSVFVLEATDDWGMRIVSSGQGVNRLYLKQTDLPSSPGVTIDRVEVIGQNLKSATIKIYTGPFNYPIIVLDDIANGRIVASAEATVEPSYSTGLLEGHSFSGRAVLLDAQFTGPLPTASSIGVNGMVTDLSLIGSLTGDSIETRHVLIVEPITTVIASGLALIW